VWGSSARVSSLLLWLSRTPGSPLIWEAQWKAGRTNEPFVQPTKATKFQRGVSVVPRNVRVPETQVRATRSNSPVHHHSSGRFTQNLFPNRPRSASLHCRAPHHPCGTSHKHYLLPCPPKFSSAIRIVSWCWLLRRQQHHPLSLQFQPPQLCCTAC